MTPGEADEWRARLGDAADLPALVEHYERRQLAAGQRVKLNPQVLGQRWRPCNVEHAEGEVLARVLQRQGGQDRLHLQGSSLDFKEG